MGNLSPRQKAEWFYKKPDKATRAKIEVVSTYFSIYFKIINNVRRRKRIVFIDLFCGKGIFDDGTTSVPIRVLQQLKRDNIKNIKIIMNDMYFGDELRQNIVKYDKTLLDYFDDICFLQEDSREYNIRQNIKDDDVVVSYIDSFSYIRVDSKTVYNLTKNFLSDSILFLNIHYLFQRKVPDKLNLIEFFNGEDNYNIICDIINDTTMNRQLKTDKLIRFYIGLIQQYKYTKLNVLPLFFRKSHENSCIFNVIFIMSKSMKGIDSIRDVLNSKDKFKIQDGKFVVEENTYVHQKQICLFDDNEKLVWKMIPIDKHICLSTLIEKIDEFYRKTYGYVSAYNKPYIRKVLKQYESENKLDIKYLGKSKRQKFTYADKTIFRKKD